MWFVLLCLASAALAAPAQPEQEQGGISELPVPPVDRNFDPFLFPPPEFGDIGDNNDIEEEPILDSDNTVPQVPFQFPSLPHIPLPIERKKRSPTYDILLPSGGCGGFGGHCGGGGGGGRRRNRRRNRRRRRNRNRSRIVYKTVIRPQRVVYATKTYSSGCGGSGCGGGYSSGYSSGCSSSYGCY